MADQLNGFDPLSTLTAKDVLVLCAHCDDAEIGSFALLKRLQSQGNRLHLLILASTPQRYEEQTRSFSDWLRPEDRYEIGSFADNDFPYYGREIKSAIRAFAAGLDPALVLTHHREDGHQDHRTVSDFAYNIFRNHTIWEYEIPKYDVDTGQPNVFVRLSAGEMDAKVAHLMSHFASQQSKQWYTADTYRGLSRLRGLQSNSPYAEAFYCRKLLV